jgi:uncharacterized membrane protein (DUF4010 family)
VTPPEPLALRLGISLGIGLLIGAERERRKGEGPGRAPAGIRTFAVVSLLGGVCLALESEAALVASALVVGALAALGYRQSSKPDPGLTSEMTLLTTLLLGALAIRQPALAAGIAVTVAILLASRTPLHRFVQKVLTEQELHDGLLLAAASLVVLPLVPDHPVGPLSVFNPRTLWRLVVLVMAIGAAGYVALRALGPRFGLPLSGFASGFVSSAATIGSLGALAAKEPSLLPGAVAGAVLSTLATIVQMVLVVGATDRPTLSALALPLLLSGIAAAAYGLVFGIRATRKGAEKTSAPGRAFALKTAILFAATVSAILFGSAALLRWLGPTGLTVAAALAGFADTHAAAISVAALVASGKVSASAAVVPILAGLTTNTATKCVVAVASGGRRFALQIIPGLLAVILAAWGGALTSGLGN